MCVKIMRLSMGTGGSRYRAGRRRQRRARGVCEKRQMRDATCMRFECGIVSPVHSTGPRSVASVRGEPHAAFSGTRQQRNWHEH